MTEWCGTVVNFESKLTLVKGKPKRLNASRASLQIEPDWLPCSLSGLFLPKRDDNLKISLITVSHIASYNLQTFDGFR